ncbi:citrate/2-methylcitrate synthase [Rossellomorea vietnamensis]|uniref:citrate/2-methylcitrate synthase n=1 Tax=Rossellomorea vietnamensis TaxID=218284 RepID=UPI0007616E1D|nr:citrate/2-methylcitrate synthase [Rossellomorea vietnamensis]
MCEKNYEQNSLVAKKYKSVEKVLADTLDININLVSNELAYRSIPQWDSLGHVGLLLALEEEFEITIDSSVRDKLNSVFAIKEYIYSSIPLDLLDIPRTEKIISEKKQNDNGFPNISRGLAEVLFDTTKISKIDGEEGKLLYRGISINELVEKSCFEETAYLLIYGTLPTQSQLDTFISFLARENDLPRQILDIIFTLKEAHPTEVLRTAISALGAMNREKSISNSNDFRKHAMSLMAKVPNIISAHLSFRENKKYSPAPMKLSFAANFYYLLTGQIPTKQEEKIIDKLLILHADHGSNASSFATRVAISTESDIYAALTSAISTFAGARHGGAIERVMTMINEISEPGNASSYVKRKQEMNQPVMGFGHRVYKTEDPRAFHIRKIAQSISYKNKEDNNYKILEALVDAMEPYINKGVNINVDFYASIIYHSLGLPKDLYVSIFATGRMPGWVAQAQEQFENNILIRPLLHYIGENNVEYLNIEHRNTIVGEQI